MVGTTGFLKLSTKQDFANNMAIRIANNEEDPLIDYRMLFENRKNFFNVMVDKEQTQIDPITELEVIVIVQVPQVVASVEDGVTDEEHRIVNTGSEEEPVWVQQHKILDPGSLLCLKGFTEAELESILGL